MRLLILPFYSFCCAELHRNWWRFLLLCPEPGAKIRNVQPIRVCTWLTVKITFIRITISVMLYNPEIDWLNQFNQVCSAFFQKMKIETSRENTFFSSSVKGIYIAECEICLRRVGLSHLLPSHEDHPRHCFLCSTQAAYVHLSVPILNLARSPAVLSARCPLCDSSLDHLPPVRHRVSWPGC